MHLCNDHTESNMFVHAVFVLFFYLTLSLADHKCYRSTFRIKSFDSGLTLSGPEQDAKGNLGQLWWLTVNNLGAVEIRNYYSGKCLDVQQSGCVENETLLTYACHGGRTQRWFLNSDGTIHALCNRSFGIAFDVNGRAILTRIFAQNIISKFIIIKEKPDQNKHKDSNDDDSDNDSNHSDKESSDSDEDSSDSDEDSSDSDDD